MNAVEIEHLVTSVLQEGAELRLQIGRHCLEPIMAASELIAKAFKNGRKLLICGNGGSAADAQHIAAEFIGKCTKDRRPLPAIALTTDTSALTAIGNDYGFDKVFARQIQALGQENDVLLAITTSGNSANVLSAVRVAHDFGLTTVGLSGLSGGQLAKLLQISILVPSEDTQRIQEGHIVVGHLICQIVEATLFT